MMGSSEIHKRGEELREKPRVERGWKVEDSKRLLKQAIFTRGGEKLQEDLQLVQRRQEQQQLEEEERAFSEMLERNNED
ncbi:MAG: hypothetical protein Q9161_000558 [Pseudevernia consocians]